jgi:large subunit ribosomal protein L23
MDLKDTLVRALVTEKSTTRLAPRTYAFEVGLTADKPDIQAAVEQFYGVKVEGVRTAIVRGKAKRFGRFQGKRGNWKKAYVTLAEGHAIQVLGA